MYHSITLGTKNTWDDWHLVSKERSSIALPVYREKTLELSARDGVLDISESLTGAPVYNNSEGDWEFQVMNDYKDWVQLMSEIMEYVHGKTLMVILEDDPGYYYKGLITVKEWQSNSPRSTITIHYSLLPTKYKIPT